MNEALEISGTNVLNDNNWHNVVMTFQNSVLKFYVDGLLISSKTGTSSELSYGLGTIAIGRDGDADGGYFEGILDDFGFWNRALNEDEILQLYNADY